MNEVKGKSIIDSYMGFIDKALLEMNDKMITHKIVKKDEYIFLISCGISQSLRRGKIREKSISIVLRDQNMNFMEMFTKKEQNKDILRIFEDHEDIKERLLIDNFFLIKNLISMHFVNEECIHLLDTFNENITVENFLFPISSLIEDESFLEKESELKNLSSYLKMFSLMVYNPVQEKKVFKGNLKLIQDISSSVRTESQKDIILGYLSFLVKSSSFDSLNLLSKSYYCFILDTDYRKKNIENFLKALSLIIKEKSREIKEGAIKYDVKAINSALEYLLANELVHTDYQSEVIQNYADYLKMSIDMSIMHSIKVDLRPDDIFVAHDKLVEIYEISESEIENEKIFKRAMDDFEVDDYVIKFPRSVKDFIFEGKSLRHCVGSYASRHADSETTVVFIREKKFPDSPFFTLEYRYGQIYQLKGKNNCEPGKEISKIANEFLRLLSLKPKEELAC